MPKQVQQLLVLSKHKHHSRLLTSKGLTQGPYTVPFSGEEAQTNKPCYKESALSNWQQCDEMQHPHQVLTERAILGNSGRIKI